MASIIENLKKNGFTVTEFDAKEAAADYLVDSIHGKTVGMGGSATLGALDIYDRLKADNTVYWHAKEPGADTCIHEINAQVFLTSANAISEEGYILNIDGQGNRLAASTMKKERVIFVVGQNKLSGPFPEALERARNIAGPLNAKRLNKKTPCAVDGVCHDCHSPDRICNALLVLWGKTMWADSMEVVLIHEDLGF